LANNLPQIAGIKERDSGFALGGGGGTDISFSSHLGTFGIDECAGNQRNGQPSASAWSKQQVVVNGELS
jgi:hypothetical protein